MRQIRHPLSGAIYELDDQGHIMVSHEGASGVFTGSGAWIEGTVRVADPELCRWIDSGNHPSPKLKSSRRYAQLTSTAVPET